MDTLLELNNELKDLYLCWEKNYNITNNYFQDNEDYSKSYYLQADDMYLNNRTIIYGQEANAWNENIDTYLDVIRNKFKNDTKKTPFIKTIILFNNALINNISKISKITFKNGIKKGINTNINGMYESFFFSNGRKTLFQHEIDILKPNKVILLCGSKYKNRIQKAFDVKIEETLNIKTKLFIRFKGYNDIDFFYTCHPNARLSTQVRNLYNDELIKLRNSQL